MVPARADSTTSAAPPVEQDHYSTCSFDSWSAGWRSLLVRRLTFQPVAEDVTVPPVAAQFVALITGGGATVESRAGGQWRRARSGPGTLSLTAPGRSSQLRWRSHGTALTALHLWIPETVLHSVAEREWDGRRSDHLPDELTASDPMLPGLLTSVAAAAEAGADELYAESAATVLAVHLLMTGGIAGRPTHPVGEDARVTRAVDFMRAHLGQQLRLADIAAEAQLSPYHFLRVFKNATGRTPSRYLTAVRVAEATRRLRSGSEPVTTIAYECGFSSPAHLAATFTRETGMSPTAHRRLGAR